MKEKDFRMMLKEFFTPIIKDAVKELAPEERDFKYMPIQEIFDKGIIQRSAFYQHVKKNNITLYKLGSKTFVDKAEFENSFKKVNLKKV